VDQLVVIQTLVTWLRSSLDEPRLQVKCDHVTAEKVVSAIYLEKKLRGEGRGNRLKELDVAIVDPTHKTVRLALEVDPVSEPFKPLGVFFSLMLADVYVPSGEYSPDGDYKIADCVAIYATVLSTKECSQKRRQFRQIEEMIKSKVVLSNYGLKAVHLCYGQDENEVVAECQRVVRSYFKLKPGT
jgi:hypothetical protein